MRRAGRRQMQIWVSGMPSFDTPRLQLFFDVAFEKAVSGLAIECNRTNSRMIGQQAYDLIRLLPADIAVETPFAFTAPADVPQCDSRAQQHRLAQPVLLRQRFPGQCRDQTPEGIARMAVYCCFCSDITPGIVPKTNTRLRLSATGSKLCNISVPSLNSTLNPAASR